MIGKQWGRMAVGFMVLTGISLAGCAGTAPEQPFSATMSDRLSAEEAGYTVAFVDVILAACQTARSSSGRQFSRLKIIEKNPGTVSASYVTGVRRRLVRTGPKTVRPVFRAVREFEVPLIETPPITNRHSLAEMVEAPALYDTLHVEIVSLMAMVDAVKINGNKAKLTEIGAIVEQARIVCEGNSPVVEQVMARAPVTGQGAVNVAAVIENKQGAETPEVQLAAGGEDTAAQVQAVSSAERLALPGSTRFVALKTLEPGVSDEADARARIRLFAPRAGMTLDLPAGVEADVASSDALESLVTVGG